MFDHFKIIRFQQQLNTLILKLQIYCVTNDTHKAGYNSLNPLVPLDNQGYQDKLLKNKDLRDEIMKCQIQLQALLELAEQDNDIISTKLDNIKPPAKETTPNNNNDETSQDLFSEDNEDNATV